MRKVFFLVGIIIANFFCLKEGGAQDEENASPCAASVRVYWRNLSELAPLTDMLLKVLSFLDVKSLCCAEGVCRSLRAAGQSDAGTKLKAARFLQIDDASELVRKYPACRAFVERFFSYSFNILPEIPYFFYSLDLVVSNDGSTVAGVLYCPYEGLDPNHWGDLSIPFRLTGENYTRLEWTESDWLPNIQGVSPDGSVVVGTFFSEGDYKDRGDRKERGGNKDRTWVAGKIDPTDRFVDQVKFKNRDGCQRIFDSGILCPEFTHIAGASSDGSWIVGYTDSHHPYHLSEMPFLWQNGSLYDLRDVLAAKGLLPEGCDLKKEIYGISTNGLFIAAECSFGGSSFACKVCIPLSFGTDLSCVGLRKTRSMVSRVLGFGSGVVARLGRMFFPG